MSPLPHGRAAFDHLRWLAALAVVLQHVRATVMIGARPGDGLATRAAIFVSGFGHQAVLIFFVLSGFLVGGSALRLLIEGSTPAQRRRFAADRFTRIAVVLWPALAVSAVVAAVAPAAPVLSTAGWCVDQPDIRAATGAGGWIATALMLNEIVTRTVPFDGPLWSLAYEWTYYVLATAAVLIAGRHRGPLTAAVLGYAVLLVALCLWGQPRVIWLMSAWIGGAAMSRVRRWDHPLLSLALLAAALIWSRLHAASGYGEAAVAIGTMAVVADRSVHAWRFAPRLGHALAAFSFSLYAVHWPVMLLAVAVAQRFGLLRQHLPAGPAAALAIALLVALSYAAGALFSFATEQQTDRLRRWLSPRAGPRGYATPSTSSA